MRGLIQYYPLISVGVSFLAGMVALAAFLKALSGMAEVLEDGDDHFDKWLQQNNLPPEEKLL